MNAPEADILSRLRQAGSAEEFFFLLHVPYEARVLNVARLHILKRMGEYLANEPLAALPPEDVAARCKAVLERAYADFVASTPLQQRVFKVLKNAARPRKKPFVSLDSLK